MKKRFIMGRGLIAAAFIAAGGGALTFTAGPAAAATPSPHITKVASSSGATAIALGVPQPKGSAKLSADYVAYSANGDEAVVTNAGGKAHVYLIAGASEANEYHIVTGITLGDTAPLYGTLVAGDAYLVAGTTAGTIGMTSIPGGSTTNGSASVQAVANKISPVAVAFDNSGNLLISEYLHNGSKTTTGIQEVAKSTGTYYGRAQVHGGLYTLYGTEAWTGVGTSGGIFSTDQVYGFSLGVDSSGNIVEAGAGAVFFINETGSAITRYGTTIHSHTIDAVAGTPTSTSGTCGAGNKNTPATGATSIHFQQPHVYVASNGDIFVADDNNVAHKGCTWIDPAAHETIDSLSVTAGHIYSLTGAGTTTAYTTTAPVAATTSFPYTSAVSVDAAGNLVLALSGTTPTIRVVAESTGHYYGQLMHAGKAYKIGGGASGTGPTLLGFHFAGAAFVATPPEPGITSLTKGATGDYLLTDGASAAAGTLYQFTAAPTSPPAPSVTSVTPSSGHIAGGLSVTVHGTNLTGITKVKFGGTTATTVHFVNSTEVTAKDPAHTAGAVTVSVTATLGPGSKATAFTYIAPTSTSVTVTISGTRYKGTKLHLGAHVLPTTAAGKVTFDTTDPTPIPLCATLTVTSGSASCTDTLSTTGPHKIIAHFTPTTGTLYGSSTSSGTPSSGTFTVTTRPTNGGTVRQPFQQTVLAGRLTLSCTRYATVETPPTITASPLGAAIKTCPIIILPKVQLNGVQQTRTSIMNPIYVFTARGTATAGWALSAAMVPTVHYASDSTLNATPTTAPHVAGTPAHESITVSTSCASKADFCDETGTLGATQKHGNIPATDLSLNLRYTCTPAATNHNPTPAPKTTGAFGTAYTTVHGTFTGRTLALCTAAAGTSGGKFKVSGGKFTLTVPSIIRHGKYFGTVEYSLVSIA